MKQIESNRMRWKKSSIRREKFIVQLKSALSNGCRWQSVHTHTPNTTLHRRTKITKASTKQQLQQLLNSSTLV